ncbi:hypothetical protein ED733_000425 [Metarhizium rileyi]|uniref:Peptidase S8/S53 domain-containing protein n=1 Tax=Metarhizium rileyi (strain RCEF 4871) TaxID=1649241 RepID=A0A5C6GAN1_METRR|nr:hypothetical protein ED733_000425 [Metarhizium rileyi]
MKRLYKPGQEYHIEFDLSGMPTPVVTLEYLAQLEKHLKFESILKYVALPLLSVDTGRVGNSKSPAPRLGEMGVREIIKVMVSDDGEVPHADEAIVDALYGFKVREWEWKRVDLCSDVICEASPAVREISLYSSGSSAVLMGWASEHGIGNRNKFPLLETVNLYMQEGLEYPARRSQNNKNFRDRVIKYGGRGPSGNLIKVVLLPDSNPSKLSSELSTTEPMEDAPSWLKSTWDFATFLLNASKKRGQGNQVPPVKIAIIDDGIDATQYDLQSKIAGGASFFPYPHSSELVNSYYVPRGQHGTLMAQLICSICPDAQLYIARLEELPTMTAGDRLVTARSAAKAVDWAVNCGVNIISMSWTIQTHTTDSDDMKAFKTALEKADTANILLFGSANDQGATNQQDYFPGCWSQCIRIGGATFTGEKLAWVDKNAEYWFPGRNVPFPSKDGKSVLYESGSSVATAAATGLAGLLIYSARLLSSSAANDSPQSQDPNDRKGQFQDFQDRKVMTKAFKTMAQGEDGRFPRTDDMLNTMFKSHVQRETGKSISNIDISKLKWNRDHAKALTSLVVQIQGYPFS